MTLTYSWRGAGIVVLTILPIMLVIVLLASVNLLGKDFTKAHFRTMVIGCTVLSGVVCYCLGRWLNRVKIIKITAGSSEVTGHEITDDHQMWGLSFQSWCWPYLALAGVLFFFWK